MQNNSTSNFVKGRITQLVSLLSGRGAREGYLAVIDQAAISIANFIATLILARNVSPTELGMYGVGFTMLRFFRSIQEGLTIQPLNTLGAPLNLDGFKRYATSTSLLQILLALFTTAGTILAGWLLLRTGNDVSGMTILGMWSAVLWWQLQEYIRRMLYSRGAVLPAVLNTLLANFVRLGLMVYWISTDSLSGVSGLEAIGWGALVALIPGLWQTRHFWSRKFDSVMETLQKNWKFGKWIMGGVMANWVSVELYPVMTAGLVSFAAAGAYRALQNLVAPVQLLLRAEDTFLTPRASRTYQQSRMPGLIRIIRLTYIILGIPILGILSLAVLFPEEILHLLYGDTYLEYSNAMVLMAIFYALLYAYWPLQTAFKAIHISRPIFIANGVAIAVMFTVGIWTILQWGVYGTIIGQILNALVVVFILWGSWLGINKRKATVK